MLGRSGFSNKQQCFESTTEPEGNQPSGEKLHTSFYSSVLKSSILNSMWALLCMFFNVYASFSIWTGFSNTTSLLLHMTAAASFPCTQNPAQSQNKCDLEAVQGQETTSQHSKLLSAEAKAPALRSAFCLLSDTKHINR